MFIVLPICQRTLEIAVMFISVSDTNNGSLSRNDTIFFQLD